MKFTVEMVDNKLVMKIIRKAGVFTSEYKVDLVGDIGHTTSCKECMLEEMLKQKVELSDEMYDSIEHLADILQEFLAELQKESKYNDTH